MTVARQAIAAMVLRCARFVASAVFRTAMVCCFPTPQLTRACCGKGNSRRSVPAIPILLNPTLLMTKATTTTILQSMITLASAALGLVAALAWNDAIRETIR